MKNEIYYFTGTGNSLATARKLAALLDESRLHSIPQALAADTPPEGSRLIIVCPIYMHYIPHMVVRFIRGIEAAESVAVILSGGGEIGGGVGRLKALFRKQGLPLTLVANLPMPSNYTPYGATPEDKKKEILRQADDQIEKIAGQIQRGESSLHKNPKALAQSLFPGILYRMGWSFIPQMDRGFSVEDGCTQCGLCARVCPAGNITLTEGKPQWQGRCEQCFACLQLCPVEAIQYGKKTRGVPRYRHPDVSAADLTGSSV